MFFAKAAVISTLNFVTNSTRSVQAVKIISFTTSPKGPHLMWGIASSRGKETEQHVAQVLLGQATDQRNQPEIN